MKKFKILIPSVLVFSSIIFTIIYYAIHSGYKKELRSLKFSLNDLVKKYDVIKLRPKFIFFGDKMLKQWSKANSNYFKVNGFQISYSKDKESNSSRINRFKNMIIKNPKNVIIVVDNSVQDAGIKVILNKLKKLKLTGRIPNMRIFICSILPTKKISPESNDKNDKIELVDKEVNINKIIKAFCKHSKFKYIDLYSKLINKDNRIKKPYSSNGVSLNFEGYKKMGKIIYKKLINFK